MLYAAYQAHSDMMGAVRAFAGLAARSFGHTGVGMPGHGTVRNLTADAAMVTSERTLTSTVRRVGTEGRLPVDEEAA